MKIQEITPNVPPIPRTFNLGLDAAETEDLVSLLKENLTDIPPEASAGTMTFCNIKFSAGTTSTPRTAEVSVQFAPVPKVAAPPVKLAPVLPAASAPVAASPTPLAPASAAPAASGTAKPA